MKAARGTLVLVIWLLPLTLLAWGRPSTLTDIRPLSGIDLRSLDASVRPQDDLFRHVNGAWLDRVVIPPERVAWAAATEVIEQVDAHLRAIIEDLAAAPDRSPGSPARQIGDFYASFMDEARIEALGTGPIARELATIDAVVTRSDLAATVGHLMSIGAAGAFGAMLSVDPVDPRELVVELSQGGTLLPGREYYLGDDPAYREARRSYRAYLVRIFTLAGRERPERDAAAVLALETRLARAQLPAAAARDPVRTYHKFTLADLVARMPGFDWAAWARPQQVHRARALIVAQPSFFDRFADLAATESIDSWKALLAARYITAASPFIARAFVDAEFDFFDRHLSDQQKPRERWRRGVSLVNAHLGEAIGRLYVEKHVPPSAKARVERIAAFILQACREAIGDVTWMSPPTKAEALLKLARLSVKIGYPPAWRDYRGLVIRADDLLGNIERAKQFEHDYLLSWLRQPRSAAGWLMTPQTVNAYYSPGMNEFVLPAAILQPPYFDALADDAVNFGAIGAVVGHEIGHAVTGSGRQFDSAGRLRDWWAPEDDREYARRVAPLVAHYEAYRPLPGVGVNGRLTLDENLGDLAGLSIAHRAYRLSRGDQAAPVLDGLTGDQRFFMAWARIWRSKERDAYARQFVLTMSHAPPRYRALGPLGHVAGFYEAFGVRPGDRLYIPPEKRVRIWE